MGLPTSRRGAPTPPSLLQVAALVEDRLTALLDDEVARWQALTPDLVDPLEALRRLVMAGGKRLSSGSMTQFETGSRPAPMSSTVATRAAARQRSRSAPRMSSGSRFDGVARNQATLERA